MIKGLSDFSVTDFSVPPGYGEIVDRYTGTNGKTVIYIQDAHCSYSCQKSINEIIGYFNRKYDVRLALLEGGAGEYDLSAFTDIKNVEIRQRVADYFVRAGRVNGAELFAINNPLKIDLKGLENTRIYLENLRSYRDALKDKDAADKALNVLFRYLSNLKSYIYPEKLKILEKSKNDYQCKKISLKKYVTSLFDLSKELGIDLSRGANLLTFAKTVDREYDIDFKKANSEREDLIDALTGKLSGMEVETLVRKTLQFNEGGIDQLEFYEYLITKAGTIDVDTAEAYPDLFKYKNYLEIYNSIDTPLLFNEIDILENMIADVLCETAAQKELYSLSKKLEVLRALFDVSITSDRYRRYKRHENAYNMVNFVSFIKKEAPKYNTQTDLLDIIENPDLHRAMMEEFYKLAEKRDNVFMKSIGSAAMNNDKMVVLSGGFHVANLEKLLKKEGYSYVSIVPKMEKDEVSPYFELLSGSQLPEESAIDAAFSTIAIQSMFSDLREDPSSAYKAKLAVILKKAALQGKTLILEKFDVNGHYTGRVVYKRTNKDEYLREDSAPITDRLDISKTAKTSEVVEVRLAENNTILGMKELTYESHQIIGDSTLAKAYRNISDVTPVSEEDVAAVVLVLRKLGPRGKVLANRVESLYKSKVTPDGHMMVKSRINIVKGIDRSHAGGMGITIRYAEPMTGWYLLGELLHEVIAGNMFGDPDKVHRLAENIVMEVRRQNFRIARNMLKSPNGIKFADAAIWEMAEAERKKVARDHAKPSVGRKTNDPEDMQLEMDRLWDAMWQENPELIYCDDDLAEVYYPENRVYINMGADGSINIARVDINGMKKQVLVDEKNGTRIYLRLMKKLKKMMPDAGIKLFLEKVKKRQDIFKKIASRRRKYKKVKKIEDPLEMAEKLEELSGLFDVEFEAMTPRQISRVHNLLGALGEEPFYTAEKILKKYKIEIPCDRKVFGLQQGDIVYIQYCVDSSEADNVNIPGGIPGEQAVTTGEKVVVLEEPNVQNNYMLLYKKANGEFGYRKGKSIQRVYWLGVDNKIDGLKSGLFRINDKVLVPDKTGLLHGVVKRFYDEPNKGRGMTVRLNGPAEKEDLNIDIRFVNELEEELINSQYAGSKELVRNAFIKLYRTVNTRTIKDGYDLSANAERFWKRFTKTYHILTAPGGILNRDDLDVDDLMDAFMANMHITVKEMFNGLSDTHVKDTGVLREISVLLEEEDHMYLRSAYKELQTGVNCIAKRGSLIFGTMKEVIREKDFERMLSGRASENDFTLIALLEQFDRKSYKCYDRLRLAQKLSAARERVWLSAVLKSLGNKGKQELNGLSLSEREFIVTDATKSLKNREDISALKYVLGMITGDGSGEVSYNAHQVIGDPQFVEAYNSPEKIEPVTKTAVNKVVTILKHLGENGKVISTRLNELYKSKKTIGGYPILKSRINIVRGVDRSHVGGMGISIRHISEMTEKYIENELLHEAIVGNIFGSGNTVYLADVQKKIHLLAQDVVTAMDGGDLEFAVERLNTLKGVKIGRKALWDMTEQERMPLIRDYANHRGNTEALGFRENQIALHRVWGALDQGTVSIGKSNKYELELRFHTHSVRVYITNADGIDISSVIDDLTGKEIRTYTNADQKRLKTGVIRCLTALRPGDASVDAFRSGFIAQKAELKKLFLFNEEYNAEKKIEEVSEKRLMEELDKELDAEFGELTPDKIGRIRNLTAALKYKPLYSGKKISVKTGLTIPMDDSIREVKQGDVVYIQYLLDLVEDPLKIAIARKKRWNTLTGEKCIVLEPPTVQNHGRFMYQTVDGALECRDEKDIKRVYPLGKNDEIAGLRSRLFKLGDEVKIFRGKKVKVFNGTVAGFFRGKDNSSSRGMIVKGMGNKIIRVKFVNEIEKETQKQNMKQQIKTSFTDLYWLVNEKITKKAHIDPQTERYWNQFKDIYNYLFAPNGKFKDENFNLKDIDSIFSNTMGMSITRMFKGLTGTEAYSNFNSINNILSASEIKELNMIYTKIIRAIYNFVPTGTRSSETMPDTWIATNFETAIAGERSSDFTILALLERYARNSVTIDDTIALAVKLAESRKKSSLTRLFSQLYTVKDKLTELPPEARGSAVEAIFEVYSEDLNGDDIGVVRFILDFIEDKLKDKNRPPADKVCAIEPERAGVHAMEEPTGRTVHAESVVPGAENMMNRKSMTPDYIKESTKEMLKVLSESSLPNSPCTIGMVVKAGSGRDADVLLAERFAEEQEIFGRRLGKKIQIDRGIMEYELNNIKYIAYVDDGTTDKENLDRIHRFKERLGDQKERTFSWILSTRNRTGRTEFIKSLGEVTHLIGLEGEYIPVSWQMAVGPLFANLIDSKSKKNTNEPERINAIVTAIIRSVSGMTKLEFKDLADLEQKLRSATKKDLAALFNGTSLVFHLPEMIPITYKIEEYRKADMAIRGSL